MSTSYRHLARFSSPGSRPRKKATATDRLATLYDCFSEIYTEKNGPIDGQMVYVESLLRMQSNKQLSETQLEMRELLLDLLLVYANGRSFSFQDENGKGCPAGFLISHTAGKALAQEVCECKDFTQMNPLSKQRLMDWLDASGLSLSEWAMIHPRIAGLTATKKKTEHVAAIHPKFEGLQHSSQNWIRDYITWAFIGTKNLFHLGVDFSQLPSRSISIAASLLESENAESNPSGEKQLHFSHFPKLTFSRSF